MNCVCTEIANNIEQRKSHVYNYLEYEENSTEIDKEILIKADHYDNSAEYVLRINNTLKMLFPEANDAIKEKDNTTHQQVVDFIVSPVKDVTDLVQPESPVTKITDQIQLESSVNKVTDQSESPVNYVTDQVQPESPVNYVTDQVQPESPVNYVTDQVQPESTINKVTDQSESPVNKITDQSESPVNVTIQVQPDQQVDEAENATGNLRDVDSKEENLVIDDNRNIMDAETQTEPVIFKENQSEEPEMLDKESQTDLKSSIPAEEACVQTELSDTKGSGDLIARESSITDTRKDALRSLYNEKVRKVGRELDQRYSSYAKNPFSYPIFNSEWKKFYLERSYQISQQRCKDEMNRYNYQQAWDIYWYVRLKELKCEEFLECQSQLWRQIFYAAENKNVKKPESDDLSDISPDELEYETPIKRRKLDESIQEHLQTQDQPTRTSEFNRMVIAYNIALKHFRENRQLSHNDLLNLVQTSVEREAAQTVEVAKEAEPEGDRNLQTPGLRDKDLLMIYKNFRNLNQNEQDRFITYMQTLELIDPERYSYLQNVLMKEIIN